MEIGQRKISKNYLKNKLEPRAGGNYLKVLRRDNYQCVLCGDNKFPMVHHLDGDLENNKTENLLTVCRTCHAHLHGINLRFSSPSMAVITELRQQRKTYQQIGEHLGVTRQRVHQIINGYREHGKYFVKGIKQRQSYKIAS